MFALLCTTMIWCVVVIEQRNVIGKHLEETMLKKGKVFIMNLKNYSL